MSNNHQRAHYICTPATGLEKYLLPIAGLFTFIMAWFIFTDAKIVNPNFLPSPELTFRAFFGLFGDAPTQVPDLATGQLRAVQPGFDAFKHSSGIQGILASVSRIVHAMGWACLIGLPIGILMGAFGRIEAFFGALIPPMRNAPITAFIPMFMLMFGLEESLKVNFLAFGTLVYIIPTTFDAIRNVPLSTIDKAVDLGFNRIETLQYFVLPAALPRIFQGIGICTGIAWTYLVAAETVNVTDGLGAIVAGAGRMQNTPKVWAAILLILILGVITAYGFKLSQKLHILKPEGAQ